MSTGTAIGATALDFAGMLAIAVVRRSRKAAIGLVAMALLATSPASAREVFRSIRATMSGSPGAVRTRVAITIESYTSEDEARGLLQAAGRGGKDAVSAALRRLDKGVVAVSDGQEWRINAARAYPNATGRRIVVIWDRAAIRAAPALSQAGIYAVMSDYFSAAEPFGVVELEVDHNGAGVGRLIEAAAIRVDDRGFVDAERYATPIQLLVEVKIAP